MDILERIVRLRTEKGWSEYRLASESGIPQSTISSWFRKKAQPSVQALQTICEVCGITLSEFFADGDEAVCLTPQQRALLDGFAHLTPAQQQKLTDFLASLND